MALVHQGLVLLVQVRFQYLWAASSGEGFGRLVGHQKVLVGWEGL